MSARLCRTSADPGQWLDFDWSRSYGPHTSAQSAMGMAIDARHHQAAYRGAAAPTARSGSMIPPSRRRQPPVNDIGSSSRFASHRFDEPVANASTLQTFFTHPLIPMASMPVRARSMGTCEPSNVPPSCVQRASTTSRCALLHQLDHVLDAVDWDTVGTWP